MSASLSHTFPLSCHGSSRPANPPRVESAEPISYESVWRNVVAVVPLIVIVAIVIYLITAR